MNTKYFKTALFALALFLGSSAVVGAVSIFNVQQGGTGAGTFTGSSLITGNGTSPFYSTATTTASCSGSASCSSFTVIGSSPVTITATGGGGSFPFTSDTNFNALTNSTSTPIWFKLGLQASSTSYIAGATFLSGGNVGIANTNPASTFQIGSNIAGTAQVKTIAVKDSATTDYANLAQLDSSVASARASLLVSNSASGDWANNFFQLAAHGSTFASNFYLTNIAGKTSDAGWGYLFNQGSEINGLGIFSFAAKPLVLGTNNLARLYISSAGLVGISSTTPAAKLGLHLLDGDTNRLAFSIGSSTSNSTTTLFSISNIGSTTVGRFGACSGTNAVTTDSSGTFVCGTITGGGGITALGNYATTTGTAISFSTTTLTRNGETFGQTIIVSANGIMFTPTLTGTLDNAGLTNSSVTINTGGALTGGGSLSLGGTLNLNETFPFTPTTNFAVNTSATSTPIWARLGIFASSTSQLGTTTIVGNLNYRVLINVVHADGSQTQYFATTSSDRSRGQALQAAVTAEVTGDSIYLSANTFDVGANELDLSIGGTGTVNLYGAGKYATVIKTASPLDSNHAAVVPGSNSVTADLSITASINTVLVPWGVADADSVATNATLRNVYLGGKTDISAAANGSTITYINVDSVTNWDGISVNSGSTINVYNSSCTATQDASVTNFGSVDCFITGIAGINTINIFDSVLSATGGTGLNRGIWARGSGTANVYGGSIFTSGTAAADLYETSPAIINVSANTNYSSTRTTGTITYLGVAATSTTAFPIMGTNLAIGTTTAYSKLTIWGADQLSTTFPLLISDSASTTLFRVSDTGVASTTNLIISGIGSGSTKCLHADGTGNVSEAAADCGTSSGSPFPFTPTTDYAVNTSATSTPIWARLGIFASSTSQFDQVNVGSSTSSTMSTSTDFGNFVISGNASTTNLWVSNSGGVAGCATFATDGKISNTGSACGGSGTFPFTVNTTGFYNQLANSTSTQIHFGATGYSLSASSTAAFDQINIGSSTISTMSTSTDFGNFVIAGNASTTRLTITGTRSALLLANATGDVAGYGGASACSANNFVTTISAVGGTTCGTATISGVSLGSNLNSLSVSGSITGTSYNGSAGVSDWTLNMANANSWTAGQSFVNATSTGALYAASSTLDKVFTTNGTSTNFASASSTLDKLFSKNASTSFLGLPNITDNFLYTNHTGSVVGAASSSFFGYTPLNPTRQITVAGTANQITSSAGAQDLSADRTWTLSIPSLFVITNASTTQLSDLGPMYIGTSSTNGTTTIWGGATSTFNGGIKSNTGGLTVSTLTSCSGSSALTTDGSGNVVCGAITASGGTFPFTPATNFNVNMNATTTGLWLKNPTSGTVSLAASSTSWFDQINVGSTTSGTMSTSTIYGNLVVAGNATSSTVTAATVTAANFIDTSFTGNNCIGESSGIIGTTNCVASLASAGGSLTISSPTGNVDASINAAHTNTFTVLQNFSNASTSLLSVFSKAYFGGTATTTIDIAGNVVIPSGSNLTITGKSDGCATFATGQLNSTGSACGGSASAAGNTTDIQYNGGSSVFAANDGFVFTGTKVGIGTTTPFALLSIQATSTNGTGAPTTLFAIASSSQGNSTTTLLRFSNIGNLTWGATTQTNYNIAIDAQTTTDTAGSGFAILAGRGNGTGVGGNIEFDAGTGGSTGIGGAVDFFAGSSGTSGDGVGGGFLANAGNGHGIGNGGAITFTSGVGGGTSGVGGAVSFTGGMGGGSGNGGGVTLTGGASGTSGTPRGGNVTLKGGDGFAIGNTNGGTITLQSGNKNSSGNFGDILFNNGAGTLLGTFASTTGNFGIGDATPASLLTVGSGDLFQVDSSGRVFAPNGASGAGNLAYSFVNDTDTGFYRSATNEMRFQTLGLDRMTLDANGSLGIGSTTPWALLSVASSTPSYKQPLFAVATSSDMWGQLFLISATSTSLISNTLGSDSGVRIGIGTSTQYGYPGTLDQLVVPRINTADWSYLACETPTIVATISANAANICGSFGFLLNAVNSDTGTWTRVSPAGGGYVHGRLTLGIAAGGGVWLTPTVTVPQAITPGTTTPVVEVIARISTPLATTTAWTIGFSNAANGGGVSRQLEPSSGCYFEASSTLANWQAICKNNGTATIVDTLIASSTSFTAAGQFYRFRIEMDANAANFYIQATTSLAKVASITTNLPTSATTNPDVEITMFENTNSANQAKTFDIASIRYWFRRGWPIY